MFMGKAGGCLSEVPFRCSTLGKALALPTIIGRGWRSLPGTNAVAYHENEQITDETVVQHWAPVRERRIKKSFSRPSPGRCRSASCRSLPTAEKMKF
jgi:hypothetical protein